MKKLIVTILVVAILFVVAPAKAQTVSAEKQYRQVLIQLIQLLIQQVELLQKQLVELRAKQGVVTEPQPALSSTTQPLLEKVMPVPKGTSSSELPKDITPPKLTSFYWASAYQPAVSWPNPDFKGYGNVYNFCSHCAVLVTDEPSTAKIHYMSYDANPAFHTPEWETNNNTDYRMPILDREGSKPENVMTRVDSSLQREHIFRYSDMDLAIGKTYFFIVEAADAAGNKYSQEFEIRSGSPKFKWGFGQQIVRTQ